MPIFVHVKNCIDEAKVIQIFCLLPPEADRTCFVLEILTVITAGQSVSS